MQQTGAGKVRSSRTPIHTGAERTVFRLGECDPVLRLSAVSSLWTQYSCLVVDALAVGIRDFDQPEAPSRDDCCRDQEVRVGDLLEVVIARNRPGPGFGTKFVKEAMARCLRVSALLDLSVYIARLRSLPGLFEVSSLRIGNRTAEDILFVENRDAHSMQ
jgi:hypothetical protein